MAILLFICTGIFGSFEILQFEISSLMNCIFFLVWKQTGYFYQLKMDIFTSFWARVKYFDGPCQSFIPFLQFTEIYITSFRYLQKPVSNRVNGQCTLQNCLYTYRSSSMYRKDNIGQICNCKCLQCTYMHVMFLYGTSWPRFIHDQRKGQ